MKILVRRVNANAADVTFVPNRLARLFGASRHSRIAIRVPLHKMVWTWADTSRAVSEEVERAIDVRERGSDDD
jgi:hypothetical protein